MKSFKPVEILDTLSKGWCAPEVQDAIREHCLLCLEWEVEEIINIMINIFKKRNGDVVVTQMEETPILASLNQIIGI